MVQTYCTCTYMYLELLLDRIFVSLSIVMFMITFVALKVMMESWLGCATVHRMESMHDIHMGTDRYNMYMKMCKFVLQCINEQLQ